MLSIPIFLVIFTLLPIFHFQSEIDIFGNNKENVEICYSEAKWEFLMLRTDKLAFDLSDNYYGILEKFGPDESSFAISNVNGPNLDIQFSLEEDQSLICHYMVYVDRFFFGMHKFKRRMGKEVLEFDYKKNDPELGKIYMKTKTCKEGKKCEPSLMKYPMEGGGTFNEVMDDPKCLYDFYKIATERSEYELLRYCAKGYFYRGFDLTDPESQFMRNDWVLYLMNGELKCNVSGPSKTQFENNRELLDKGYQLEMVQINANPQGDCKKEATLCQYKDNDKEGRFMMAAILGSVNYGKTLECYEKSQRDGNGQYIFKLRVGHYCSKPKEYEQLNFDLSFIPNDLADEGVQEDKKVQILLERGIMRFSTNYLLCAEEIAKNRTECEAKKAEVRSALEIKLVELKK